MYHSGGMLVTGEAMHVWRQGVYVKSLSFPQFYCEPQIPLKKKKYLFIIIA